MVVVSIFADFVSETAVLLLSGCVSVVTFGGFCVAFTYAVYKNIIYSWSEKKPAVGFGVDKQSVSYEPTFCKLEKDELKSKPREFDKYFFSGSDEVGNTKTFKNLKKYLRITVASSVSKSTYDKDAEIREFLEHLVGTIILENLDDVPLTPLSDDDQYVSLFSKYHPKLSSILTTLSASLHSNKDSESLEEADRPSTLYGQLRCVIQEAQEKAALLPSLSDYASESGPVSIESHIEKQSYEDILTTAVLNKIVSRTQNNEPYVPKNINGSTSTNIKINDDTTIPPSPNGKFPLLIEEHIEEVTTKYQISDNEEPASIIESNTNYNLIGKHRAQFPELGKDVVDVGYNSDEDRVTEFVSNVDSWEDNWLFQKKKKSKLKKWVISQVSVPMLVPNPSEKYRALIGGVDVDETSDLSECSDSIIEEQNDVFQDNLNMNSIEKTNYIYKYDLHDGLEITFKTNLHDELVEGVRDHDQDSSGVTSISRDLSDGYSFSSISPCRSDEESLSWCGIKEATNEHILLGQVDSGEGSLEETQPEIELNLCTIKEVSPKYEVVNNLHCVEKSSSDNDSDSSPLNELATPPKPGTIAEREHRKWEQAAPIPNNPYTKESIAKRNLDNILPKNCGIRTISDQYERTKYENTLIGTLNDISKYGRNYYVNINSANKRKENIDERKTRSACREEQSTQNGFGISPILHNEFPEKRKLHLVRVSSWSDRKNPDVKVKNHLPSVRELAKQFSGPKNKFEVKKIPIMKNQMVHSLTARSMSKQFREGLKNNFGKNFNRNIVSNGNDTESKFDE